MSDICHPPADWSCRWTEDELDAQLDDDVMGPKIERAEAFAWSLLAALTNYRIGTCPVTIRPCVERCAPPGNTYRVASVRGGRTAPLPTGVIGRPTPYISGGIWYNACGCRPGGCECTALSEVRLPSPVGSIVEVRVDGEVLPRSAYRVYNGSRLIRVDGEDWPGCQDLSTPEGEGFTVTYYRGQAPNIMTRYAAGVLANEFLLACDGDDSCRLPHNLRSMTRSGEAYEFDETDFSEGTTGIPEVEALIRIYNPHKLKSPVFVASPDDYLPAVRS